MKDYNTVIRSKSVPHRDTEQTKRSETDIIPERFKTISELSGTIVDPSYNSITQIISDCNLQHSLF